MIVVVVFAIAVVFKYSTTEDVLVGPRIEVEPNTFDFGRVKYGDVVKTNFIVKNIGSETLEIKSVTTSCGCTKGEIVSKVIESGESSDLKVSFDPAVHKDDSDMGLLTRTIYIKSNDLDNEEVEVTITADVYKP